MSKKLAIIIELPLTQRDYERFQLAYFQSKGIEITILDITQLVLPNAVELLPSLEYFPSQGIKYVQVKQLSQFENAMEKLKGAKVLLQIIYGAQYIPVYKTLRALNVEVICYQLNVMPITSPFKNTYTLAKSVGFKTYLSLSRWYQLFLNRIYLPYIFNFKVDVYIVSGKKSFTGVFPTDDKTKFIKAHSHDYDLWMDKKDKLVVSDDIIVFIDQYVPFHKELLILGCSMITPEEYYGPLNHFFDELEKSACKKVIIAAHPHGDDEVNKKYYKHREVYKGMTMELIAKSSLILTHGSTSLSWAVLFNKPMMGIVMDLFKGNLHEQQYQFYADSLDIPTININKFSKEDLKIPQINIKAYQDYIENYLAQKDALPGNTWQNLCHYILEST